METKKLEFRGGPYVSMLPFGFFIVGSFVLAALNIATSEGFWILALVGLVIGMFLCKDPAAYFDTICNGTASNLLTTAIFCWLWSGAVAGILKASGLVNGLIWLGLETKSDRRIICWFHFPAGMCLLHFHGNLFRYGYHPHHAPVSGRYLPWCKPLVAGSCHHLRCRIW